MFIKTDHREHQNVVRTFLGTHWLVAQGPIFCSYHFLMLYEIYYITYNMECIY